MKIRLSAIALIIALMLSGCGNGGNKSSDIVPSELAQAILDEVDFKATLVQVAPEAVENWYFLSDYVSEYAIYINGDVVPAEELAVLKTKKADDAAELEKILDQRLDYLLSAFENYQPAELGKIKNPIRAKRDNVVVLVLTDDPKADEKVSGLLK